MMFLIDLFQAGAARVERGRPGSRRRLIDRSPGCLRARCHGRRWLSAGPAGQHGLSLPLPEPAVLDAVAAGGHVAPGTGTAVGSVVEGPPAVWVGAGFQPWPGAITLGVADHQQQGEQPGVGPVGGLGAEADLPAGPDLQCGPGGLRGGLQGLQGAGRWPGSAAVGHQQRADALARAAGEVQLGRVRRALNAPWRAPVSQPRAAAGSSSRSEPLSPSQVLTNDCTSSSGIEPA